MNHRPVKVVNNASTRSGTNEDGEGNDATFRQENVVHEPDHADADMPIDDLVDVFMNALVARAYETPERTRLNSAAVKDGEVEESDRRSTDNIKAGEELMSVANPTADHMAVTRSQSAELKLQQ